MDPRWRHPYGLRPTLRHLMIVVVFVSLMVTWFRGASGDSWLMLVPLGPPVLALLVFALERAGPAKNWLAGVLASLFLPALAVWCDLAAWRFGQGGPVLVVALVVVNAMGMVWLARTARRLPRPCPGCGRRSLLPLGRHSRGMTWCASCGFAERAASRTRRGPATTGLNPEADPVPGAGAGRSEKMG